MNRKLLEKDLQDAPITREIIAAAYAVHGKLGSGFLEKVYENALAIEIAKRGLKVMQQYPLPVLYEGQVVGEFFADLVVEDRIICELKASETVVRRHEAQLVNYLAATGYDTGLLINFAERVAIKRKFRIYRSSC